MNKSGVYVGIVCEVKVDFEVIDSVLKRCPKCKSEYDDKFCGSCGIELKHYKIKRPLSWQDVFENDTEARRNIFYSLPVQSKNEAGIFYLASNYFEGDACEKVNYIGAKTVIDEKNKFIENHGYEINLLRKKGFECDVYFAAIRWSKC